MNRLSGSVAAALAVAALAALLETGWARAASGEPLNLARAWIVSFGLLAPVAFAVAAAVAGLVALAGPQNTPRSASTVSFRSIDARRDAPLLGLFIPVWTALVAHLALALAATELAPLPYAATLAFASGTLAWLGLGLVSSARRAALVRSLAAKISASAGIAIGVLACAGPIAFGVLSGSTNGDGGFWGIFGVLKRQELDLRAPALVIVLALGAALGVWWTALRSAWPGLLAAVCGLGAFVASGLRLLDDAPLGLSLERGAALSRSSLRVFARLTDRDGDGVSRWFGANDCDDGRDDVYPGAVDAAGNGVDEDCSGADATPEPTRHALRPSVPEPPVSAQTAAWPKDLNVILITVDTLRYDLGYTGYPRPISPNLDRLAARSVVFDRAYALASYTGKSVGPLLIGRYPSETNRGWLHFNRFGTDETFVQERLRAAGVRTIGVHAHWYFTPEYGLGRGFDLLDTSATPAKRQIEGDKSVTGDKLSDAVLRQLSDPENTRGRFFLWAHYLDPHAEYVRHEGMDFGSRGRDLYDSEVAFTDQQIGRVLDFVAGGELAGRTAIVVTSDHGEAFGENGMYRHGFEVWEVLVRVPLIVSVPGVSPIHHAVRRGAIDLAPTLLELFGLPLPSGEGRLSGESLGPDIAMAPGHVPEARPVFIDMSAGPYNEERQALIEGDLKLIMSAGRGALGLYDLAKDPHEAHNLLKDPSIGRPARERFAAFQSQLRLVRVKPH